jgi:hypothetical protein
MLAGRGSGGEVLGGVVSGFSVVGEGVEAVPRMGADALEYVAEVGEGIELEKLARAYETGQDGGGSPAVIAAQESRRGGISPSDGDSSQAALGTVRIRRGLSKHGECSHRPKSWLLGRNRFAPLPRASRA